ncbi:acyl carrier protein [Nocardia terpenica]|uniref:acyl carrier protein n=1 Tax=Nocardia terpenica TaxID=455432 RepID=UPI001894E187|nr:acyl carrier protein [Nocardia terpenica]MBF6064441.1 acyl carrier protein [Nocardia terpenica]MBF6106935.1 acyl carrier protein [Nocardia terpenica]MBF6114409.1 acyl carrier protein [Nocardia terpenica]MBF6121505.1 acyl carrier protein [Nocardia terpenica]MBF6153920.1 acyl carrier protein [Nocardia terpenica]
MQQETIVAGVSDFIRREARWQADPSLLTSDYPLLDSGVIDSVTLLKMVAYLQKSFGIVVRDEDLLPENFADIDAVVRFVGECQGK